MMSILSFVTPLTFNLDYLKRVDLFTEDFFFLMKSLCISKKDCFEKKK